MSNINACQVIGEAIKTTLGPRGLDKMIIDQREKCHISNDGATILQLLDIVHPAAKTLVDIAKSQDAEIGDGTTSVTLLGCEFMTAMKRFVEDGVHPQLIIRALRTSTQLAVKRIQELAVQVGTKDGDMKDTLIKCASTAMSSKVSFERFYNDFFSKVQYQVTHPFCLYS